MDPNNSNQSRRKLVLLVAVVVLVVIGVFSALSYLGSFQKLTIKPGATGTTTVVYLSDNRSKPIHTNITADQELRLKRDKYVVVTSGDGYETLTTPIDLKDKPQTITLNPQFTSQKLAGLLETEQPMIRATIYQAIGEKKLQTFTLHPGKLYKTGEWYGTTITPTQTTEEARLNYTDTFRLIAKKENGKWRVVTTPPDLLLSHVKYPDIPREILIDINKNPD